MNGHYKQKEYALYTYLRVVCLEGLSSIVSPLQFLHEQQELFLLLNIVLKTNTAAMAIIISTIMVSIR